MYGEFAQQLIEAIRFAKNSLILDATLLAQRGNSNFSVSNAIIVKVNKFVEVILKRYENISPNAPVSYIIIATAHDINSKLGKILKLSLTNPKKAEKHLSAFKHKYNAVVEICNKPPIEFKLISAKFDVCTKKISKLERSRETDEISRQINITVCQLINYVIDCRMHKMKTKKGVTNACLTRIDECIATII
jgi:hypothetical protein